MEDLDIRVSDKAIFVNGAQMVWALDIYKQDYFHQCLHVETQEEDISANAYPVDEVSGPDGPEIVSSDGIAWK